MGVTAALVRSALTGLARGGRGLAPGGPGWAGRHPGRQPSPAGAPGSGGLMVLRCLVEHVLDVLGGDSRAYR
jgi:hypothetical protein